MHGKHGQYARITSLLKLNWNDTRTLTFTVTTASHPLIYLTIRSSREGTRLSRRSHTKREHRLGGREKLATDSLLQESMQLRRRSFVVFSLDQLSSVLEFEVNLAASSGMHPRHLVAAIAETHFSISVTSYYFVLGLFFSVLLPTIDTL
ncbi:hypothetical protein MRB53_037399 [Persea americana]|nr:hypothetical protein MRB53_037399 [Persea americana]